MRVKGLLLIAILWLIIIPVVKAKTTDKICAVYFTGVGCPHCAKTDPVILGELLKDYPNLVIIEYEIYQQQVNAPLLYVYDSKYNSGLGIPLLIFNKDKHIIGDTPILNNVRDTINTLGSNDCPLSDRSISFDNLNISSLPGKPKLWRDERILIKESGNKNLKNLLFENLDYVLENLEFEIIQPQQVALSGQNIEFEHAIRVDGWILQWNGKGLNMEGVNVSTENTGTGQAVVTNLTLAKILSLAAVDAVNPCALAVLSLMLIGIITYNPRNKMNVLFAGIAFTASVFVVYLFYGLVIIKFFQLIQALTVIRLKLYKILAGVAIFLGILNIKDFIRYKPGSFATEMPMSLRPRVKKIISGVTSPKAAIIVGAFVTIFLLPCTIGPYVIAGGILSVFELVKTIPWLLIYNLVFVSPMLAITVIVYVGIARIENVSKWKEKNIRYLHLIAGSIILCLGIGMIFGLV